MSAFSRAPEANAGQVTVSVVSHGHGQLLPDLFSDLARVAPGTLRQVIVTRNAPEDQIDLPQIPGCAVTVIDNDTPRGFGANHNAAFAHCTTEWFAVVNPDVRLPQDPFAQMLAARSPGVGLIAPRVFDVDGEHADSARVLPTPWELVRRRLRPRPPHAAHPEWYAGMFLLVRSQAMRQIGGFDQRFFLYCEDVDLCTRLRLAGWALSQCADACIVHDARRASHHDARHFGWHVASLLRLWGSSAHWRYRDLLENERRDRDDARAAQAAQAQATRAPQG